MRASDYFAALGSAALAVTLIAATPHPKPAAHATSHASSRLVTIRMDTDFRPHRRSSFGKVEGYDRRKHMCAWATGYSG